MLNYAAVRQPRFILHGLSLLFSLTSIALFTSSVKIWNANFFHNTGPIKWDYTDALPLFPLSLAVLFDIFVISDISKASPISLRESPSRKNPSLYDEEKACRSTNKVSNIRRQKRWNAYHLLFTTILLLILPPSLLLAGFGGLFRFWRRAIPTRSTTANGHLVVVCNVVNLFTRECEPTMYRVGELQIGGIVTGSLVWMATFILVMYYLRSLQRCRIEERRQAREARHLNRSRRKRRRDDDKYRTHQQSQNMGKERRTGRDEKTTTVKSEKPQIDTSTGNNRDHAHVENSPKTSKNNTWTHSPSYTRAQYYQPHIHSSRQYDGNSKTYHSGWHQNNAINQVRQKLGPKDTINVWLAQRYSQI